MNSNSNKRKEEKSAATAEKRLKTSNDTVEGILFFIKKKNKHKIILNFGTICEVHKKSIEKILSQNIRIDTKLKILIAGQKNIEERMINLEKGLNKNNNDSNIDPDFVKVINNNMYISYCISILIN